MADVHVLTETDLRGVVGLGRDELAAVAAVYPIISARQAAMPPIMRIDVEDHNGEVDVKSAYLPGYDGIAIKVSAGSSDSASLVVDMLCTGHEDPGPVRQRMFWGVSEGVLAAALIVLAGDAGLTALQQVIAVIGLPIFVMVFAMMFALIAGLRSEDAAALAPEWATELTKEPVDTTAPAGGSD